MKPVQPTEVPPIIEKICRCGKVTRLELQPGLDREIIAAFNRFVHFIVCDECHEQTPKHHNP
jgi:hypothetical protein